MSIFQITGNKAFESLLSGSIPKLKADHFSRDGNIFRDEVDSDGGIFSGVKLVADIPWYNWTFADALISNKDDLEFLYGVSIAGKTYLIVHMIWFNNSNFII